MKRNIILILALLCSIISCTTTETFDIAAYQVPQGWTKTIKEDCATYSVTDQAKAKYGIINMYASSPSIGNAGEDFRSIWQKNVAAPFNIQEDPATTAKENDGWKIISGSAAFTTAQIKSTACLTTFTGYGKTMSILSITNDAGYQNDIQDFIESLSMQQTATNTSVAPPTLAASVQPPNKLAGVWNAVHLKSSYYDQIESGAPYWLTFFDNGRVYSLLPDAMNSFNKDADDLGYYQFTNGQASLVWHTGTMSTGIDFINDNQITVHSATGDETYFRCKSVAGARLQGSWTSYADASDPSLDGGGIKPLIRFTKDGRFTDEGIFVSLIDKYKSKQTIPGSGTYSLSDFTLTLHYDDGGERQISFTGFLSNDVNINSDVIFLARSKFRKHN